MNPPSPDCPPTPATVRIDNAVDGDAEVLATLIRELADFEGLSLECHTTPDTVRDHLLGPRKAAIPLLARVGTETVGFAVFYRTYSTFAAKPGVFVEDLYVRPDYREQGVGKALLREIAKITFHAGYGRMEWATLRWNEKARRLYGSLGAVEKEEWVWLRLEGDALATIARCDGSPSGQCGCGGKGPHHHGRAGRCGCNGEDHHG